MTWISIIYQEDFKISCRTEFKLFQEVASNFLIFFSVLNSYNAKTGLQHQGWITKALISIRVEKG